jgi:pyoverdine/dityrosine biosynthesis protein Dit1
MGEVEALRNLNKLAESISNIHEQGAEVLICSDGRVFSDLVGVTEDDVSLYREELKKIVEKFSLNSIRFFDLEDEYDSKLTFDQMRFRLEKQFSKTEDSLRSDIKNDKKVRGLFNGIHRFLREDFSVLLSDMSKNQVNKLSKQKAYKVVLRSNAWSDLVERRFPNAFRLSIHPQDISSLKFPIKLLPSEESWGTPWHRVPVFKDDEFFLMKHGEALRVGATLKKIDNYAFFEIGDVG